MCHILIFGSVYFFSANFSQKMRPEKQTSSYIFVIFMKTKKTRSAIPSNFQVVARRDLRSEAQS